MHIAEVKRTRRVFICGGGYTNAPLLFFKHLPRHCATFIFDLCSGFGQCYFSSITRLAVGCTIVLYSRQIHGPIKLTDSFESNDSCCPYRTRLTQPVSFYNLFPIHAALTTFLVLYPIMDLQSSQIRRKKQEIARFIAPNVSASTKAALPYMWEAYGRSQTSRRHAFVSRRKSSFSSSIPYAV